MAREKKGRPVKCTPEQLEAAVNQMIYEFQTRGVIPTDYRLTELTGVSKKTQQRWFLGTYEDGENDGYQEPMQLLVSFRSQICVQNIASASSNKAGWIFLSKQLLWGGFQDSIQRTETSGKQDITITVTGASGKPVRRGK